MSVSDERTPLSVILIYAAPAPCIGFMFFLVGMYPMKFSTDVLLIAPGVMGLIFGISRIWEGISDPLAGYLSDRTNTRIGRRRPWMLASLAPIVVVFSMMWSPPQMLAGFVPNVEQTETAKLAIRSLFALFPLVSLWCGALLLSRLALNREAHARVRAALDSRR